MTKSEYSVVIVGGGAAGIGAARRLHDAGRGLPDRGGARAAGRARLDRRDGHRHPHRSRLRLAAFGGAQSLARDRRERRAAPSTRRRRPGCAAGYPPTCPEAEQEAFADALMDFYARVHACEESEPDRPAATLLEPGNRWNGLIDAVSTYVNGAELARISVTDFNRYDDSGVNWRVVGRLRHGDRRACRRPAGEARRSGHAHRPQRQANRDRDGGRARSPPMRRSSPSQATSSPRRRSPSRRRCPRRSRPPPACRSAATTSSSSRSKTPRSSTATAGSSATWIAPAQRPITSAPSAGR